MSSRNRGPTPTSTLVEDYISRSRSGGESPSRRNSAPSLVEEYMSRVRAASPMRARAMMMAGAPSRCAGGSGGGAMMMGYYDTVKQVLWMYVAVAVVVFLLLWWIAYSKFQDVHAWAQLPAWLSNYVVLGLMVLVCLLLASYVTAHVSREHLFQGRAFAVSMGLLFLLVGLLLLVTGYLVYRTHNFTAALYLAVLTLLLTVGHFVVAWRHRRAVALLDVPLLLLLATFVYYLWYMADESANCLSGCAATHEVHYV
jgi:hypothetical protein